MRKVLYFSFFALVLFFSGCSKTPLVVDMNGKNVDLNANETVVIGDTYLSESELAGKLASLIAKIEQNTQNVYFDFDQFSINSNMETVVSENTKLFNIDEAKSLSIKIEGNCDEWGTDEYNYALGLKRAKATKDALIANGVDSNRISIVSYGESNPTCSENSKTCWDKNRRAEFKLLP